MAKVKKKNRLRISPKLLRKARELAGISYEGIAKKIWGSKDLAKRAEIVKKWESGGLVPELTHRQFLLLARALKIPYVYLFLDDLPEPNFGIPDFRTVREPEKFNADFINLVHEITGAQAWLSNYRQEEGHKPYKFVGEWRDLIDSLKRMDLNSVDELAERLAPQIAQYLRMESGFTTEFKNPPEALRRSVAAVEALGVAVMRVSKENVPVEMFRGLSIADPWAPLIAINSKDSLRAQTFTLFHELAHIWLGEGGISDVKIGTAPQTNVIERFCDKVAVHILMPYRKFLEIWKEEESEDLEITLQRVSNKFNLSVETVMYRAKELGLIDRLLPLARVDTGREKKAKSRGGDAGIQMISANGTVYLLALATAYETGKISLGEVSRLLVGRFKSTKTFLEVLKNTEGRYALVGR